jgi:hypothetical protein
MMIKRFQRASMINYQNLMQEMLRLSWTLKLDIHKLSKRKRVELYLNFSLRRSQKQQKTLELLRLVRKVFQGIKILFSIESLRVSWHKEEIQQLVMVPVVRVSMEINSLMSRFGILILTRVSYQWRMLELTLMDPNFSLFSAQHHI